MGIWPLSGVISMLMRLALSRALYAEIVTVVPALKGPIFHTAEDAMHEEHSALPL